jgi:hypothetical protein
VTAPRHTAWEYAILRVDWAWLGEDKYEFQVAAWVDQTEIFSYTISEMFSSEPLARMGKIGWESVALNPQSVLGQAWHKGYQSMPISTPITTNSFFKRPLVV